MFIQNGTGASFALLPPVPEPSSIVIMLGFAGMGLVGVVWRRRRIA
jgi:LPXTG-motif cell wall-anchored protein